MKKQVMLKTTSPSEMIAVLEKLGNLPVDLNAEGRGKTITLTLYGEREEIRRNLQKIKELTDKI